MKKLALALVCLVSVAFFASCDPEPIVPVVEHPEPSVAVVAEEGFLYEGQVVDLDTWYDYGFRFASNAETQKELKAFYVSCAIDSIETILCDSTISGTEFVFKDKIYFESFKELVGSAKINAVVTDVDGQSNSASIKVDLNKEETLAVTDFSWNRHGSAAVTGGIEEFGLQWTSNGKEDFAKIRPLEGASLFEFDPSVWENVTTELQKAALFSEQTEEISVFNKVSAWASHDYDYVIGTTYNGKNHLIHITKGIVTTFKGTDIVINGQAK